MVAARKNIGETASGRLEQEADRGSVSSHPNEADRNEQDWHKACGKDSPLNMGEKELRKLGFIRIRFS